MVTKYMHSGSFHTVYSTVFTVFPVFHVTLDQLVFLSFFLHLFWRRTFKDLYGLDVHQQ